MSKMRMPEMSVVRFAESDVICSSIHVGSRILLSNWANGTSNDGKISLADGSGTVLFLNSYPRQTNVMSDYFGGGDYSFYDDPTQPVAYYFNTLINNDSKNPENASNGADGYYAWDGNGGFGKIQ